MRVRPTTAAAPTAPETRAGELNAAERKEVGSGVEGTGVGGSGVEGTGVEGTGVGGTGVEGTGVGGSGVEGTGVEGSGVEGTGVEGTGVEGSGVGTEGERTHSAPARVSTGILAELVSSKVISEERLTAPLLRDQMQRPPVSLHSMLEGLEDQRVLGETGNATELKVPAGYSTNVTSSFILGRRHCCPPRLNSWQYDCAALHDAEPTPCLCQINPVSESFTCISLPSKRVPFSLRYRLNITPPLPRTQRTALVALPSG
ncbi:MAG: hypothetical protein BGO28_01645 [Alphaproteobacteria bacterium 43-37]|nr:MAG: hypothetical protein BGO28_01645 [Alphaproteobacteria bacterium 43-37]